MLLQHAPLSGRPPASSHHCGTRRFQARRKQKPGTPSMKPVTVHRNADAFPEENAFVYSVDPRMAFDERVKFGAKMCGYLGYGGFCMYEEILYFRSHRPDDLESKRGHAPGCNLIIVRPLPRPPSRRTIVPLG
eukprot:1802237-Amphidinium_carterae.1